MKPNTVGRAGGSIPPTHPVHHDPAPGGLMAGTIVLSLEGEMPVEFLEPGDRIITRDSGMARLAGVIRATRLMRMISFAAGSLGDTRPDQDLILPADQPVLIRDWRARALFGLPRAMIPAAALIDGEFIRDLGEQTVPLYQLRFDRDHVIYAGGLELAGTGPADLDLRPAA